MAGRRVPRVLHALALAGALALVLGVTYAPHALLPGSPVDDENAPGLLRLAQGYLARAELSLRGQVHERGFHTSVIMLQELTGLDWLALFRYLPAAWLALSALLLWAALRPWPGAPVAAALVAFVPTSVRFLGPAFLVPSAFGLAWVAATLLLAPRAARSPKAAGALLLLVVWAFFVHLLLGFAALLVLLCALPFVRGDRRSVALLALVALVPVLALSQAFADDVGTESERIGALPTDLTIFDQVGLPFILLWAVGCAVVALRPPAQAQLAVQAATLASLVAFTFIVLDLSLHLKLYALYDRWHQPWALLATVPVAGALVTGGQAVVDEALTWLRARGIARRAPSRAVAGALCVAGLLLVTQPAIAAHIDARYYHVINDKDWEAYTWAAEHVNGTYGVFLSDPWKSVVFAAVSGKEPFTYLAPGAPPVNGPDYAAYRRNHHNDSLWLVERDVSVVIDPVAADGPGFAPTGPMTYQLGWDDAKDLASLRAKGG
ncbi:MAG: hypothetical protein LC624_07985 [Halobacteriales archaeon]|nr:hypothetical protein [Halobacteriales archaeon]